MYRLHVVGTAASTARGERSALQEAEYQVAALREELAAAREEVATLKGGASVEEETSRRMAKEREERVARVQHTARKKLMQQQLGKGFYSWQQEVLEQNRRLRLLPVEEESHRRRRIHHRSGMIYDEQAPLESP